MVEAQLACNLDLHMQKNLESTIVKQSIHEMG